MSTDQKQNTSSQGEINIIDLFLFIGEFLKKVFFGLFDLLRYTLAFLLRKWYYFVLAVVITVLSGMVLNKVITPHFQSDMIIRSNTPNSQVIISSLNRLGDYAKERNYSVLSELLNMNSNDISSIKEVEVLWYYDIGKDGIFDGTSSDVSILSDTNIVMIDSLFIIRLEVYNPLMLKGLESGLIDYLNSIPFLLTSNRQRISELEATLLQTEYEIEKLDSLQKKEYYTNAEDLKLREGQFIFTNDKTVRLYHNEIFQLLKMKQETERDLSIYRDVVTKVEEFNIPKSPKNGIVYYAGKLIWYFLGLALITSLLITFRRDISQILK